MIPYFATGCFIWFVYVILYKRYDWGISLLLGNGSAPVWNYNEYYVGPLWFLLCYFISVIAFHLILKIKQEIVQFFLLAFLFIISLFYKCKYGLLPFDLLNSIPATICLWIGYQLRSPLSRRIVFSRCALLIGSVVWIICVLYSELSMASHIYKLYFFDLLGALYGTILVYFFINWVCETSIMFKNILVLVGKYSLLFLAIHSVDIMLYISDRIIIYSQIDKLDGSIVFILNVLLKLFILFLGYLVISHTPILRKVFIYD